MFRAFVIACLVAAVSAFAPVARVASRITVNKMSPADLMTSTDAVAPMAKFSQLLASETDFGGYTGPIVSLLLIGALILSLNPPLEGQSNKDLVD